MNDLISRQAARDAIRASTSKYTGLMEMELYTDDDAVEAIEGVPSAEPEIIRCKDCKHYNEYENGEKIIGEEEVHDGWCMRWSGIENVNRHDYCSYGERAEQ